jgi:hypothetical protein
LRVPAYISGMEYWKTKLKEVEAELEAARTLGALNGAARKLMLARRELKRLEQARSGRATLTVGARRRALPHDLIGFVDLETRPLQVLDHPLREHPARIIDHVLLEEPTQQVTAAADRIADREGELGPEGAAVH